MAEVKAGAPTAETTAVPSATPVNAATRESPGPQLPPLLHQGRRLSLRRNRMGEAHRPDHRRQGQRHLRAERCRSPQRLVDDRHQHRGQQISARHARHARARDRRPRPGDSRGRDHPRLGHVARLFPDARRRRHFPRRARRTSCCASTPPSTRRSGSTWDATASSPTPTPRTGTGTRASARVEFGVTGYKTPQCSACFINSVKDSLDSILTLAKTEGMLFKWGSGTGTNLSSLRSSTEGSQRRRHRQRSAQLHERL